METGDDRPTVSILKLDASIAIARSELAAGEFSACRYSIQMLTV